MNKVILMGNVGSVHKCKGDMVSLSLATSHKYIDRSTGEKKVDSEWHRIVFFGRLGEVVREYISVGDKILVDGFIKTGKEYVDKLNITRVNKDIIARALTIVSLKPKTEIVATEEITNKKCSILDTFDNNEFSSIF